jgi:hypothetical protein
VEGDELSTSDETREIDHSTLPREEVVGWVQEEGRQALQKHIS